MQYTTVTVSLLTGNHHTLGCTRGDIHTQRAHTNVQAARPNHDNARPHAPSVRAGLQRNCGSARAARPSCPTLWTCTHAQLPEEAKQQSAGWRGMGEGSPAPRSSPAAACHQRAASVTVHAGDLPDQLLDRALERLQQPAGTGQSAVGRDRRRPQPPSLHPASRHRAQKKCRPGHGRSSSIVTAHAFHSPVGRNAGGNSHAYVM